MEEEIKENIKENKKEKKEKVNKELLKLEEENKALLEKYMRVNADMQNIKRRYDEEISKIYKYEGEAFIKKTLNILDNFERALFSSTNLNEEMKKYLSGFELIYGELKSSLEAMEVLEINALGQVFDPVCMEAVMTENKEGFNSGCVTEVMQKGYKYKDKVIRPAMVKVNE